MAGGVVGAVEPRATVSSCSDFPISECGNSANQYGAPCYIYKYLFWFERCGADYSKMDYTACDLGEEFILEKGKQTLFGRYFRPDYVRLEDGEIVELTENLRITLVGSSEECYGACFEGRDECISVGGGDIDFDNNDVLGFYAEIGGEKMNLLTGEGFNCKRIENAR